MDITNIWWWITRVSIFFISLTTLCRAGGGGFLLLLGPLEGGDLQGWLVSRVVEGDGGDGNRAVLKRGEDGVGRAQGLAHDVLAH